MSFIRFTFKHLLLGSMFSMLTWANDLDFIKNCKNYKKIVFDKEIRYGPLMHNAPIQVAHTSECSIHKPLISGGEEAEPQQFGPAARLGRKNTTGINWFCGGTLISYQFVLTAVHCFQEDLNIVRLGELDFDSSTDDAEPEDFGVRDWKRHPDYIFNKSDDIALIQLDRIVKFSQYKYPACLPIVDGGEYKEFVAIGWGNIGVNSMEKPSSKLLKVTLKNFYDTCKSGKNHTFICAGSKKEPKNTCKGDSGGGLLVVHDEFPCMYYVMGITSYGEHCGAKNSSSYYVNVHFYLDWIKQTMIKLSLKSNFDIKTYDI